MENPTYKPNHPLAKAPKVQSLTHFCGDAPKAWLRFSCHGISIAFHTWNSFSSPVFWGLKLKNKPLNSPRQVEKKSFIVPGTVGNGCISLLLWGVRCSRGWEPRKLMVIFVHSVWQGQYGSCADILQGSWRFWRTKTTQNVVFWNSEWLGCWLLFQLSSYLGVKMFFYIAISSSAAGFQINNGSPMIAISKLGHRLIQHKSSVHSLLENLKRSF